MSSPDFQSLPGLDRQKSYELSLSSRFQSARINSHNCSATPDIIFLKSPEELEEYLCIKCERVAQDPYTSECGHTYCGSLIQRYKHDHQRQFQCEARDCRLTVEVNNMLRDKPKQRATNKLEVRCCNDGCGEIMLYPRLRKHMRICEHRMMRCRQCGTLVPQRLLSDHMTRECGSRGGCQYSVIGCTKTDCKDAFLSGNHLQVVAQKLLELVKRNWTMADMELAVRELVSRTKGQKALIEWLKYPNKPIRILADVQRAREKCNQLQLKLYNELRPRAEILLTETLQQRTTAYIDSMAVVEAVGETDKSLDLQAEESVSMWKEMPHTFLQDGCMIFRVSDFSHRKNKAIQNPADKRIIGPPFYTHNYGYKFNTIIYPNGDGQGENTHISIFIALNRGEYDDLLDWPCAGVVHFAVINQRSHLAEHVMRFRTDMSGAAFRRPISALNPSTGIPRLISHEDLRQPSNFLINNEIFFLIRMIPDREKVPKVDMKMEDPPIRDSVEVPARDLVLLPIDDSPDLPGPTG